MLSRIQIILNMKHYKEIMNTQRYFQYTTHINLTCDEADIREEKSQSKFCSISFNILNEDCMQDNIVEEVT